MLHHDYISPYGVVKLFAERGRLRRVELARDGFECRTPAPRGDDWWAPFTGMLDRYFQGRDLRCEPNTWALDLILSLCVSDFQRLVYENLTEVEFGHVVTYGGLARLCGNAGSARAVGGALSANPLPIFVPCHRVVSAGGGLGGFSAGVEWKKRLLQHEGWLVRDGRVVRQAQDTSARRRLRSSASACPLSTR